MILSKISRWYFSKRALPLWGILMLDCMIVLLSELAVYAVNNGPGFTYAHFGAIFGAFAFYLIFYIIGFRLFHTYSGIIRYSSFVDLQHVGFAMLTGLAMIGVCKYGFHSDMWLFPIRMKELIISALISIALMWALRVAVKYLYDTMSTNINTKPVFIYGVKEGGVSLAKSIRNSPRPEYHIDGFITDGDDMQGRMLMGVRVYPNDDNVVDIMKSRGVSTLLV